MNKRINEDEIGRVQPRDFKNCLLVRPGDADSGVEVFHVRILAAFTSPDRPAPLLNNAQLLIEVEDPDDPETQARIREKLTARARER